MTDFSCVLNQAIHDALRDGEAAYRQAGLEVELQLEATRGISTHEEGLYQAVYTIFRALPDRAVPGSKVRIRTVDRAGRDLELMWEREILNEVDDAGGLDTRGLVRQGKHGDLMELAITLLEDFCRARTGYLETFETRADGETCEAAPGRACRRVLALIPSSTHSLEAYEDDLAAGDARTRGSL